jgi:hypothetical protein
MSDLGLKSLEIRDQSIGCRPNEVQVVQKTNASRGVVLSDTPMAFFAYVPDLAFGSW